MTHRLLCFVIIAAGIVGGCAGCASNAPSSPSTPSEADKFFPDPKVAALARALERSDWAGAEKALRDGADINPVGQDDMTLPMWTMYVKNKKAFEWIFNHGADPNFDPGRDRCALFWAARADDPDWLRILLAHKANPNLIHLDSSGSSETPLMATLLFRRMDNLIMLIAAGADVNYVIPSKDGGGTAAIDAATYGWFEGIYVLMEAGADIRPRTTGGADLLYYVARRNLGSDKTDPFREKVLQLLRARGADVDGALKAADAEARSRKQ